MFLTKQLNILKTANISVELIGHFGNDATVASAARVSFHKDASNYSDEQNHKLIQYLARNQHKSPFNHAFISVRVKAPIFVGRQLVKHKFMPWNEVSRRYVDDEPEFYFPEAWRTKAENVKQGSSDVALDIADQDLWVVGEDGYILYDHAAVVDMALAWYINALKRGVCAEQARMLLPQNTMTTWIWSGTLGAFADMLKLRLSPYTQQETREVAEQIKALVEPLFPVALPALLNNKE
jgi:thymidylate synthase (FAD)